MSLLTRTRSLLHHHRHFCSSTSSSSSPSSLSSSINALCRVLSDYRSPHDDLESALRPFSSTLASSPDLLDHVLRRCRHLPSPSHRLFLFASSLPDFTPSPLSHRLLLHSLSSSRLFPLAWAHLSDHHYLHHSKDSFHILFFAYSKAHLPSDAIRCFLKMPDFSLSPDLDDLHLLLSSLSQHGHAADAQRFFHQAKSQFSPTRKTYTIVIHAWARCCSGNPEAPTHALNLFDEMRQRAGDCTPDLPAYNALIAALCSAGQLEEANLRVNEMRKSYQLEPDAATFSVFIRTYCNNKDPHSALRMLETMRRKGLTPNLFTYNYVIKLLCEKEEVDEAYTLLDEMAERGVEPDVWSYNRILWLHCKLKEVNKALRLLNRMDADGYLPDRHSYNMLLKMLIGVGRIDRAVEVWEGMEGRGFYPAACSYAVMIHGLSRKKGRVEEACRYFEVMVDEGIPPYVDTCVLLRGELMRLGMGEKAFVLVDRMRRSSSGTIQELASVMERGEKDGQVRGDGRLPLRKELNS